jgi:hypothetical protein
MSGHGGNGLAGFRVIYPAAVLQEARRLLDGITGVEERRRFAAALRIIHARLRNDPLGFGEHRYSQSGSPNTVRAGGVMPLIVRFAVYQEQRYVWVLGFHMPAH